MILCDQCQTYIKKRIVKAIMKIAVAPGIDLNLCDEHFKEWLKNSPEDNELFSKVEE
ncbi:hypothetical protein [Bacillus sp. FSL R9-9410]|uniref:hypothetical protein n=1 Tax=Bacillus sp. FSL R9-9410 TaxID=2921590 RepID=UPI003100F4FF